MEKNGSEVSADVLSSCWLEERTVKAKEGGLYVVLLRLDAVTPPCPSPDSHIPAAGFDR